MIIQESSETIRLSGDIDVNSLVTGVVACVLGHEDEESNSFKVEDICFAGPSPRIPQRYVMKEEPKYVMFVSGLGFSLHASAQLMEAREMLLDMLTGRNESGVNQKASRIVKLVVAGNCIGMNVRKDEAIHIEKNGKQWSNKNRAYTAPVVSKIDEWLAELGKHIEIDLLPGEYDPSSALMPQQAFHPALLPECSALQSIRCTTNPYASTIDGTQFLGTSGQTVNSIRAYSNMDEAVQIMCRQLEWSHQAPMAPDCLNSYPFKDYDPYIIEELPHVYFAGNQPEFNSMMFDQNGNNTRLISIPEFETSFIAVLLNLKDLSVEICSFG
jgi:DNA polymerase delta subunit 2